MEKDILYIVIPAYNEAANIEEVINDWYPVVEKHNGNGASRLVIIDDGSRDDTYKIVQKCGSSRPLLQSVTKANSGHGATVLYGYNLAIQEGADYIFQTDSDGQTLPDEFEEFWNLKNDYDMVIGWRRGREDGYSRRFVTKTLKMVIKLCFKVDVTDANTPFRLMKTDTLKEYIALIPKDYFLSNVIISVIYAKKKLMVKYLPITFRPRQGGENSINMKRIITIGKTALVDFVRINRTIDKR